MPNSREIMTQRDHRSPGVPAGLALGAAALAGAYLLPGAAFHLAPLRRALGVGQRTLDGTGVALTFDDGPHPEGTPAVLALLAARRVRATFFLVGEQVARAPALAGEIVAAGHRVGLHCDRHRNLLRLGPAAVAADIARARARIEDATGAAIALYRPPYGIFNAAALAIAHAHGWRPLLWTHWGRDWEARATPESIAGLMTGPGLGPGSVLLAHDADDYGAPGSWRRTLAALPLVLDELDRRGLEATTAL
ncbi:MAG TPA: polysaccharide deacetylase family protein [Solirubrobacteraceae bacterium]|nr:polysaccharide deacetylase family protein [Solirubrobacteraceae bacterium]